MSARTLVRTAAVAAGIALTTTLLPGSALAAEPAAAAKTGGSAGCGQVAPAAPGVSTRLTVSSGGRERTYQLHLPADYDAKKPQPLILTFHGRGSTGAITEGYSKMDTLPAIVAYPDGVVGTGDGNRQAWQGAPYAAAGVDDVLFTGDLLDQLESTLCVDTKRVYAVGKSNGGGFTGVLACRLADRIAAIAPVGAAFYNQGPGGSEPCQPSRPVSVIAFHGTADTTIPYPGVVERGLPAVPAWIDSWVQRDGCNATPPATRIEPDITVTRHLGCAEGAQVQLVTVEGGGHTWPGADIDSGGTGQPTTQTIEAHELIWDFLRTQKITKV